MLGLAYPKQGGEPVQTRGGLAERRAERDVNTIDDDDVWEVLEQARATSIPGIKPKHGRRSEARAGSVFAALSSVFGWLRYRRLVAANPCATVKRPAPSSARDRVLADAEIQKFWTAASEQRPQFQVALKLLLITGCRLAEVTAMRRDEISDDGATWNLPASRTKNKRPHVVPLPAPARDLIAGLTPISSEFVFLTIGRVPIVIGTKTKRRLDAAMKTAPWRLHDLRRTAVTGMAEVGVAPQRDRAVRQPRFRCSGWGCRRVQSQRTDVGATRGARTMGGARREHCHGTRWFGRAVAGGTRAMNAARPGSELAKSSGEMPDAVRRQLAEVTSALAQAYTALLNTPKAWWPCDDAFLYDLARVRNRSADGRMMTEDEKGIIDPIERSATLTLHQYKAASDAIELIKPEEQKLANWDVVDTISEIRFQIYLHNFHASGRKKSAKKAADQLVSALRRVEIALPKLFDDPHFPIQGFPSDDLRRWKSIFEKIGKTPPGKLTRIDAMKKRLAVAGAHKLLERHGKEPITATKGGTFCRLAVYCTTTRRRIFAFSVRRTSVTP